MRLLKALILFLFLSPLFCVAQSNDNFNKGFDLFKKKDYKAAMEYFSKAIAESPGNADAYNFMGIMKSELGDFRGSIDAFNKALAIDPSSYQTFTNRAHAKMLTRDYTGAWPIAALLYR